MRGRRLRITLRMMLMRSSFARAEYLKRERVFRGIGHNCSIMNKALPLYPELIRLGDNVHIASNVGFVTHDITNLMLNGNKNVEKPLEGGRFQEKLGCIDIGDNVFVGSGTRILYNVRVGSNVVIGSGSVVNRDIPDNCVAAGIPARIIGTFEEFVKKQILENNYPNELAPKRESISIELADILWERFEREHGYD